MDFIKFKDWLMEDLKESTAASIVSRCKRISGFYDIEDEYRKDKCTSLLNLFNYSAADLEEGSEPRHDIPIKGNYSTGTATLKAAITKCVAFFEKNPPLRLEAMLERKGTISYCGDLKNFTTFIGPYCRNKVNAITKSERAKRRGICEYCGKKAELQSAHFFGIERPTIIKNILDSKFRISADYYEVDLPEFEKLFVAEHLPVENHIYFLCDACHNAYDGKGGKTISHEEMQEKCGH